MRAGVWPRDSRRASDSSLRATAIENAPTPSSLSSGSLPPARHLGDDGAVVSFLLLLDECRLQRAASSVRCRTARVLEDGVDPIGVDSRSPGCSRLAFPSIAHPCRGVDAGRASGWNLPADCQRVRFPARRAGVSAPSFITLGEERLLVWPGRSPWARQWDGHFQTPSNRARSASGRRLTWAIRWRRAGANVPWGYCLR